MEDARILTSEQLMAEMSWIRRLARALVKDDAIADDVAQDAWVIAAEQRPSEDRPLRPWLARVVVNLVRTRRRSDARRGERDAAFDADRIEPTPAELVERVQLQRAVADEVLALAEPYRSTVLLHFIEGNTSAQIARRLGIPEGTVRRRLKVALDQLRDALRKRTDQPRRGWLAALVPFARSPGPAPAIGVLAMKKVIGIVVLLVLLLAIGGALVWRHRARGENSAAGAGSASIAGGHTRSPNAGDPSATAGTTIPPWLLHQGASPRRIAGRVMFHGAPVAGAKVQLGLRAADDPMPVFSVPIPIPASFQSIAEVTSRSDGTFDFGVQPPAPLTVSASATNRAAVSLPVPARADQIVLELGDCRSRLSGTVADASGGAITKARITITGEAGTESDGAGNYSICMPTFEAPGAPSVMVRVAADGYGTILETLMAAGDLHHDFLLVPEAVLVGTVTTPDGQPVSGARVVAGSEPTNMPYHAASSWGVSDRDGKFRILGLSPGSYLLTAAAAAGAAPRVSAVATPASTSREVHLVLASLARVRGHVYMNGKPLGGASVRLLGLQGGAADPSQPDGSFVIERVPYGAAQIVAPGYDLNTPKEVRIDRPEVDGIRLDVTKMATVRGHVTRNGKPVSGAVVVYNRPPQAVFLGGPLSTHTDSQGAYTIDGIPRGIGTLFAWHNPGKAFNSGQSVNITSNEDKVVDVDLDRSGEVQGTVVDEAGTPLPGVYMRMDLADGSGDICESMTDAHGQFDCPLLAGGMYQPTVSPSPGGQGLAAAKGDRLPLIDVPRTGVVTGVTLAVKNERLAIRGRVVDDTGAPVPDVHVSALGREPGGDPPSTRSAGDGSFEIKDLARGSYMLRAHAADGSEDELPAVEAGADALTIRLARAGAIEGTVSGFSGTPSVEIASLAPTVRLALATVDGTTFSRIGLRPGHYTVEAHSGAEVGGDSVEVHPGETVHVALRSRGTGTVEGTVTELGTHKPVSGMRCDAKLSMNGQTSFSPPEPAFQAYTDAAGHFTVRAPLGRTRIFCFAPGTPLSPAGGDVEVTSAAPAKVNVFSVRATLGAPPGDVGFMVSPGVLPIAVGQVLPKGPAELAGLRPGDHLVTIDGVSLEGLLPAGAMFLLANHKPGTTVSLGIERAGVASTVKVSVVGR